MLKEFTATVWQEGDWYVAQCLEIDIASQGHTAEEALANLKEAIELYYEDLEDITELELARQEDDELVPWDQVVADYKANHPEVEI